MYFIKQFEEREVGSRSEKFNKISGSAEDSGITVVKAGEGGLFGALWELGEILDAGLEVDILKVPVKQEVIEILELAGESPYEVESSGCFLLAGDDDAMEQYNKKEFTQIGAVAGSKARVITGPSLTRYLTPPSRQAKDAANRQMQRLPQ